MTTITTSALSDALPSSVPKLDSSGSNWAIFTFRFRDAVQAKGFWGHFDGSVPRPVPAAAAPTAAETKAIAAWEKDEYSAKSLLTQKLPDSAVVMIYSKETVQERWEAVTKEYSKKSAYAKADLRAKFMGLRCPEKGNPREFLETLRVRKEELAQAGVVIEEKDYTSVIISSLPYALSNFASGQLAAAQYNEKPMTSNDLISMLLEESERQRAQRSRYYKVVGKGKDGADEALAVGQTSKPAKEKGKRYADVTCWNCDEKGHISRHCKKPRKPKKEAPSKSSDGKASGSGTASVVVSGHESEEEGAWAVIEEIEEDVTDWFDDVVEAMMGIEKEDLVEDFGDLSGEAFVASETTVVAELYDSGCTNHISPYRTAFEDFINIPPRFFKAANQQTFSTIGKGDVVINVPNGECFTQLRLQGVLYSPNVAYTLVSIGRLDDAGFSATFGQGKCVLRGPDDQLVGEVARNSRRIYKVEHEEGIANPAVETLTLQQLHRRLGHPSVQVTRDLLKKGMAIGLRLEYTPHGTPFFCDSCIYAKAIRKAVSNLRGGKRAEVFGGEVHSDLWGKSPLMSKGGKWYWITFIDDKTRFTLVYFLATKDESFGTYLKYEAWLNRQMGKKVLTLNTDRGGEYVNDPFSNHLALQGTTRKLSVHDTHEHSGVAERRNRTIQERVHALLHASGLPKYLWAEAARYTVWLLNRTTTKAVEGMTPYEAAFGCKPDLTGLRKWGEKVYVRIEGRNKLGGRVKMGKWLRFSEDSKGVRVYWPDTKAVTVE